MTHTTREHARRLLPLACVAAFAIGCETAPLARTNPFDPEAPLDVQILGVPDSLFSLGDTFRVSLVTNPLLPPEATIRWAGVGLQWMGNGLFRVSAASHIPRLGSITAEIGPTRVPRRVSTTLIMTQRVFTVVTECDTGCHYTSLEWNDTITTTPRDSLGFTVSEYLPAADVTAISRDTNVMTVPAARSSNYFATVRPRTDGQTWIVLSFGATERIQKDSFHVTILQRLWHLPNNCPLVMDVTEGDTVGQIGSVFPGTDFAGSPFLGTLPPLQWAMTGRTGNELELELSPSGLVRYISGDGVWFVGQTRPDGLTVSECTIHVPWPLR